MLNLLAVSKKDLCLRFRVRSPILVTRQLLNFFEIF